MTRFAIQRVKASPEALELIERLVDDHGPLAFLQLGECVEGSSVMCLTRAELLPSDDDVKLGEIGGAPFYIAAAQYERGGRPTLLVDVAPGPRKGLPLQGLEHVHFVTRTRDATAVGG